MQRKIYALVFGTALLGAAALAACSGGGGGTSSPLPGNIAPGGTQVTTNGSTFTLRINRTPIAKTHKRAQANRRNAKASRKPEYISNDVNGLQIAVTATGVQPVTKFIDISAASVLCTGGGNSETCTLPVPTIAATESVTITEVDTTPVNEGIGPNPPGYGSMFPANSNILAIGTGVSTTTGGVTSFTLSLNPVLAIAIDANNCGDDEFGSLTASSTTNAAYDQQSQNNSRIVVTAGVAQTLFDYFCFFDAEFDESYAGSSPQPFVDVNGSATPATWLSNSQHVLLALTDNTGSTPTPTSTGVSMANNALMFNGNCINLLIKLDGGLTQPATVTMSNNLTAINPFTNANYLNGDIDTIVPISVTTPSATISQGTMSTTTVTASDFKGTGGLTPFAAVDNNGSGSGPGGCFDSGSNLRATVMQTGAINTSTWLQTFIITPAASPTLVSPVTCTFVLADVNTGNTGLPGYVVTPTVTVTVNP